jgi:tRNA threonylcarbamoyladenosine biosynthesis protein TsaB
VRILAIETATLVCGAAILVDGEIVAEESVEERKIHAERLLDLIDRALRRSGSAIGGIDAVAVSIGPGSFTGLRIGVSAAKGLSFATGRPILAVPTLEALARRVAEEGPEGMPRFLLPAIDARRDEVYCQLLLREGLSPVCDPRDATLAEVEELCRGKDVLVAGDGAGKIAAAFPALRRAPDAISRCSAASVARLGATMFREGRFSDPAAIEPAYIKEFLIRHRPHS